MAEFDQYAKDYRELHNENLKITGFNSLHFVDIKVNWLAEFEKKRTLTFIGFGLWRWLHC
jgi:hypothetical protein